jgi:hypothetical protein
MLSERIDSKCSNVFSNGAIRTSSSVTTSDWRLLLAGDDGSLSFTVDYL